VETFLLTHKENFSTLIPEKASSYNSTLIPEKASSYNLIFYILQGTKQLYDRILEALENQNFKKAA
jgi:hypothetical protein